MTTKTCISKWIGQTNTFLCVFSIHVLAILPYNSHKALTTTYTANYDLFTHATCTMMYWTHTICTKRGSKRPYNHNISIIFSQPDLVYYYHYYIVYILTVIVNNTEIGIFILLQEWGIFMIKIGISKYNPWTLLFL